MVRSKFAVVRTALVLGTASMAAAGGCGRTTEFCEFAARARTCAERPTDPKLGGCDGDGCHEGEGCVSACGDLTTLDACSANPDCYFQFGGCNAKTEDCWNTSVEACAAGPSCKLGDTCLGKAFDCEAVSDESTCTSHKHCTWIVRDDDPNGTRY